jgi:small-conductance mechanosensitive channel
MGSVEHIGIKSTRVRSLTGEQIVMSNADLLKSRLRNYGRMTERRVLFTIGVTYDTPAEKLEQIPGIVRNIIESQKGTRFDRSHFANHGACSLDFETVYYVLSADYNRHMDIQQQIRLQIHREFARFGVEFAYPTQRLILERAASPVPATAHRSS